MHSSNSQNTSEKATMNETSISNVACPSASPRPLPIQAVVKLGGERGICPSKPGLASWEIFSRPSGTGGGSHVSPSTAPDFLYAALDTSAYAAFFTESRMRLVDPPSTTGNPGPCWATLSRPFGTEFLAGVLARTWKPVPFKEQTL